MKKHVLTLLTLLLICGVSIAQEGKPSVKIFSNFNYDMSAEDGEEAYKEFEVKRAYLGYSYKFNDEFSTKVTFDVGKNSGGSYYTAFLKIAALSWNFNESTKINFGQIGTKNFKFMEKAWGKRYIYKSMQDQQKWANSADVGMSVDYKISSSLSADAQILNGEGYKKMQGENGLMRGGVGATYTMSLYGNDLNIRGSLDMMPREQYTDSFTTQQITTIAAVYEIGNLKLGGEMNTMLNASNATDNTKTGMSAYANYSLNDMYSLFGRMDILDSENANDEQWNMENDGQLTIFGIERKMTKGVNLALNVQQWSDAVEEGEEESIKTTMYINLECKF